LQQGIERQLVLPAVPSRPGIGNEGGQRSVWLPTSPGLCHTIKVNSQASFTKWVSVEVRNRSGCQSRIAEMRNRLLLLAFLLVTTVGLTLIPFGNSSPLGRKARAVVEYLFHDYHQWK
jgi:hypothetical protein